MEIGEYSGIGETYVNFSQEGEYIWSGTVNRYQMLPNGGLGLIFTGNNYVTGETDLLTIEWTTYVDKETPVVMHEGDVIDLSDSYSFQKALYGN